MSSLLSQHEEIARVVADGSVHGLLQPVADLASGQVVAYEALARGPAGTELAAPLDMFRAAYAAGLSAPLDWACRLAALTAAEEAGLVAPLFVNVEPSALGAAGPARAEQAWDRHLRRGHVVVEITERSLAADPAAILSELPRLRQAGARIALDDVGTHPESLALLPFIEPDVIKLDRSVVQEPASTRMTDVIHAVAAESERTGALVVAEGIETHDHLAAAIAMGATLGQGWLFGRPATASAVARSALAPIDLEFRGAEAAAGGTPFDIVTHRRPVRRATKRLLLPMTRRLESHAATSPHGAVVLTALQSARNFSPGTVSRYAELARSATFVGALGVDVSGSPADGVRGACVREDDPIVDEWTLTVVCPHFAAALVARDLGDDGADLDRRFDFAVTYDRALVVDAGRNLMARIAPRVELT